VRSGTQGACAAGIEGVSAFAACGGFRGWVWIWGISVVREEAGLRRVDV